MEHACTAWTLRVTNKEPIDLFCSFDCSLYNFIVAIIHVAISISHFIYFPTVSQLFRNVFKLNGNRFPQRKRLSFSGTGRSSEAHIYALNPPSNKASMQRWSMFEVTGATIVV